MRDFIIHMLPAFTSIYRSYLSVFKNPIDVWGMITVYFGNGSHVEILTQVWAWGGNPPPLVVLGTHCHAWV